MQGNVQTQLSAQRDYLIYMQRELERALNNLDITNFADGTAEQKILTGAANEKTQESINQSAANLKQLIIKSADIVRSEMDEITAQLQSNYVAQSEFGEYKETVNSLISATASEIRADINYDAEITDLQNQAAAFDAYRVSTDGSIKAGIVGWDGAVPIFGIAVGQNITYATVEYQGDEYAEINKNSFLSIFTASKLSFYQSNVEVAYLSNEKLYITTAHISEKLEMGSDWTLSTTNGLTLKWVGA